MGAAPIYVEDLRETFVADYVFPMFRANALYEGCYLLGTSIARPLIAKRLVEIAHEVGADAIAHGATGKGNDQVRFELSAYALDPAIKVIAPWREWDLGSRAKLIEYAERHQIPIPRGKSGEPPYSTDANLLHISYEGRALEDPWHEPDAAMFTRTVAPEAAPEEPTYVEIEFERGDPVALDGEPRCRPRALLARLNEIAGANGVGRLDLVENRFVGMKSRGVYETPGGTVLHAAHRGDRIDHPRPRRGPSQGRADAALRRADLQRLLVRARAPDAAGADRPEPGERHRHRPAQALQGRRRRWSGARRRRASTTTRSSPSRPTPSTTSATPRASSSSTRCACGCSAARSRVSPAGAPAVDFYYGLGSRYSYLASTQIERLEAETGCRVRWRPLYSGDLFAARGADPVPGAAGLGPVRLGLAPRRCRSLGRLLRRALSRAPGRPLRRPAPRARRHRRRPPRRARALQPPAVRRRCSRRRLAPR